MRREVISRRLGQAARRGREQGSGAGQAAARGLLHLIAAVITAAALVFGLVVVFGLWFALLYLWFVVLPGMLDWAVLAALGLIFLIARAWWPAESAAPD